MNNTGKAIIAGGAAVVIIIGTTIYKQIDTWFPDVPTGPGSGDELPADEPTGPGSGDELPADEPTGPGSGDELPADEPTGPGSGDELPADEPTGPGSGDELPADEPTGPGSGDELPADEPTGPGSGDELPADEPTGPGSGDEMNAVGSCNVINSGSTCVDYTGSYWKTIQYAILNCSGAGVWSTNPCPQPTMGGCANNFGNQYEMIVWHYNYGGDPFDAETAGYAAMACRAVGQTWLPNR